MGVPKGGWEGWAQVELYRDLRNAIMAMNVNNLVEREVVIWGQNPQDAVDLCLTWAGNDPNGGQSRFWPVELKCRSQAPTVLSSAFVTQYQGDCQKVEQEPAQHWQPSVGYAIAITHDWNDTQRFRDFDERNYYAIPPPNTQPHVGNQVGNPGTIYVIWAKFSHP